MATELADLRRLLELADGEPHKLRDGEGVISLVKPVMDLGLVGNNTVAVGPDGVVFTGKRTPAGEALLAALVDAERYRMMAREIGRIRPCGDLMLSVGLFDLNFKHMSLHSELDGAADALIAQSAATVASCDATEPPS